jgi:hypothetical protein
MPFHGFAAGQEEMTNCTICYCTQQDALGSWSSDDHGAKPMTEELKYENSTI